jgi:hypothetical protein
MESTMHEDELISLDDMRECKEPVSMPESCELFTDICRSLILDPYPVLASLTHIRSIR